jgi:hypothetical protein
MCDETRRWLAIGEVERVDHVCEEDKPLVAPHWGGREPYGTLLVSSRRLGLGARLTAGMIDVKRSVRGTARALLASSRATRRPQKRKSDVEPARPSRISRRPQGRRKSRRPHD